MQEHQRLQLSCGGFQCSPPSATLHPVLLWFCGASSETVSRRRLELARRQRLAEPHESQPGLSCHPRAGLPSGAAIAALSRDEPTTRNTKKTRAYTCTAVLRRFDEPDALRVAPPAPRRPPASRRRRWSSRSSVPPNTATPSHFAIDASGQEAQAPPGRDNRPGSGVQPETDRQTDSERHLVTHLSTPLHIRPGRATRSEQQHSHGPQQWQAAAGLPRVRARARGERALEPVGCAAVQVADPAAVQAHGGSMEPGARVAAAAPDHAAQAQAARSVQEQARDQTHAEEWQRDIPVIGFGGSYGGMLGSWFRMKYPHIVDGVIAGSAPILSFLGDEVPLDKGSFERIVTFDASEKAGSAPNCVPNIRRTWPAMKNLGKSKRGRQQLKKALSLCDSVTVESEADVDGVMDWAKSAFDYMAMGNYPYPSSYIMNGVSVLPAYPVRVACSYVADDFAEDDEVGLLSAFSKSLGVYYNSTMDQVCYELSASSNESALDSDFWDYIFCSEIYQPQTVDEDSMFWPTSWNFTADNENCKSEWGIEVRPLWATTQYGGRKALKAASNIVFSNGNYDPWSGTGVLQNFSDSVVALSVEGGAHHLDLMFSNNLDTPSVLAVREAEKEHMHKWAREFYKHKAGIASE
ncbi:hypothetical protein ON010_g17055 [Phytophthora cinnamomi]|nr:hypothetical protein ON010_g17055 [Phytophthora cinnamomi]